MYEHQTVCQNVAKCFAKFKAYMYEHQKVSQVVKFYLKNARPITICINSVSKGMPTCNNFCMQLTSS